MLNVSDKAVLGMCGVLAVAGLVIVVKTIKSINEIDRRGIEWKKLKDDLIKLKNVLEDRA
jgi:hypothetical protein